MAENEGCSTIQHHNDDQEHGASRHLLKALQDAKYNYCILLLAMRCGGTDLGKKKLFEMYKNTSAILEESCRLRGKKFSTGSVC